MEKTHKFSANKSRSIAHTDLENMNATQAVY